MKYFKIYILYIKNILLIHITGAVRDICQLQGPFPICIEPKKANFCVLA